MKYPTVCCYLWLCLYVKHIASITPSGVDIQLKKQNATSTPTPTKQVFNTATTKRTNNTATKSTEKTAIATPYPSFNLTSQFCLIKDDYLYLDADITIFRGEAKDIAMCYVAPNQKRCTKFPICERGVNKGKESITCQAMKQMDPFTYQIYIINGDKGNVTLYRDFTPLFARKNCDLSNDETLLNVTEKQATSTSVTVELNIEKDTYATMRDTNMKITGVGIEKLISCKSSDLRIAVCTATGLTKCSSYKACVSVKTLFFRTFTKCLQVSTEIKEVERPTELSYSVLSGDKDYQLIIVSWKGPKLNTSDDYYQCSYKVNKTLKEMIHRTTSVLLMVDENTQFTIQLCTRCGCSSNVEKYIIQKPKVKEEIIVEKLKKQIRYWQRKNSLKMRNWICSIVGLGIGLMVSFLVALVYCNKKTKEKSTIMHFAKALEYTNFPKNLKDKSTKINSKY